VLAEPHDEWVVACLYLSVNSLAKVQAEATGTPALEVGSRWLPSSAPLATLLVTITFGLATRTNLARL
jgi:hypothetical protein